MFKKECVVCGETKELTYCKNCKVYFCNGEEGCFSWTSSHEPRCPVIFNYHHPNLDEEIAFYDRLRYFENNMVPP